MMKKLSTKVLASTLGVILAGGAFTTVQADTIAKIKQSGKVVIGYRESSDPISYIVGGKPMGYAIDICNKLRHYTKKKI